MKKDSVLQVRNLTVALPAGRDRSLAVNDVSFDVYRREITCLVGESGSGKSVTAASIMHLLPRNSLTIQSGSILLEGEDITHASRERLLSLRGNRMSMVFQEPLAALNPVMKTGSQIAELIRIHHPERARNQVNAHVIRLLEDVQLPDPQQLQHAYPHQLSGGQRQRVMIAMALALEPALIIADEPTTALDVTTQAQILHLFRELLTRHNSGVLMITHDFGVVADVADQIVVLKSGQVVEEGTPKQMFTQPQHPYTKQLLAAVPRMEFKEPTPEDADIVLDVRDVSLVYRSRSFTGRIRHTRALNEVGFRLGSGQTLGVVGESGSGKSTLARALLQFEPVESGQILFHGQDVTRLRGTDLSRYRRRLQMIFQDPYKSLNPRKSAGQSITEGPIHHGEPAAQAWSYAEELMTLVGLSPDALHRYPHEFSGGQRQRICIARALAMRPEVIIADEAVSALDVSIQAQVLKLLADLHRQLNFSMIFITHDLRIAANICDEILVMHRGDIVESGPPSRIFQHPSQEYTRALLRAIPGQDLISLPA